MTMASASRAEASAPAGRVLVWDWPVRVFHWLAVASFFGAWLTAESERWRALHVALGYTLAGLVAFRLLWGLVGTRHARFAGFVRGPMAAWRYLRSLLRGQPEHHAGHNPAGALAIVALLALAVLTVATGWARYEDLGGDWLEELHEGAATAMLVVVVVHVLGVVVGSLAHRENLVRAMFTGRKAGAPGEAPVRTRGGVAALLLAAVLGLWWLQWPQLQGPAAGAEAGGRPFATVQSGEHAKPQHGARAGHHDHDDDD